MIALTFDTDWVKDETLKQVVSILKKKKIKATFFSTDHYPCLEHRLFEVNPHFNFNSEYSDYLKVFKKFRQHYPKSVSIRHHSLYFHERLRQTWENAGIKYTSNTFQPLVSNIKPYWITKNILEIPIYFMDYWYLENFGQETDFTLKSLNLKKPGLKVFDFHPIHLSLNTPNLTYYEKCRQKYPHLHQTPSAIEKECYQGDGIFTLFEKLINYLVEKNIPTYTLKEIYKNEI